MDIIQTLDYPQVQTDQQLTDSIPVKVEVGGEELLSRIWNRWHQLCAQAQSEPFALPEWIATYRKTFEPDAQLLLIAASDGERLLAVLPLILSRGYFAGLPVRKLMCPANVHSVRFSFPRVPGKDGDRATRAIWDAVKRTPAWDVMEFPIFFENGPCQDFFEYARQDGYKSWQRLGTESPILHMQVGDDGKSNWLGGTSRHFRHELRRFNRLLEAEIGTKPQLIRHRKLDAATFNEFLSLEAAGWKGQEGSAIVSKPETRAFYEELARVMTELGHFSFHSFEVNGTIIAAAYGVFTDQCFYPMKITYKEALHRCAPGHLMFNSIFEECAANGIGTVYFGGAKDPYKTKWTSDVQRNLSGVIFNSTLYPQLVHGMKTEIFPVLKKCRSFVLDNIAGIFKGKKDDQTNERTES